MARMTSRNLHEPIMRSAAALFFFVMKSVADDYHSQQAPNKNFMSLDRLYSVLGE